MNKLLFMVLLMAMPLSAISQRQEGRRSKFDPNLFKQKMETFVSQKAEITSEEAAVFFPLFHEMMDKQRSINWKIRKLMREGKSVQDEARYKEIVEDILNYEVAQKELEKTYTERFSKVLSWSKIFKVKKAVNDFNMDALRKYSASRKTGTD